MTRTMNVVRCMAVLASGSPGRGWNTSALSAKDGFHTRLHDRSGMGPQTRPFRRVWPHPASTLDRETAQASNAGETLRGWCSDRPVGPARRTADALASGPQTGPARRRAEIL